MPTTSNTTRNVLIVLGVLLLLGIGGCVAVAALAGKAVQETGDAIDKELNENEASVSEGEGKGGSAGTEEDPLAIGTEVDLGNGWRVTVNSAEPRADAEVAAANEFNEPPTSGNVYVLVNLTAAYDGNDEDQPESPSFGFTASVFGSAGTEHSSYDNNFATAPDPAFDTTSDLLPGGEATGNLVFEVGTDETGLSLRVQPTMSFDKTEAWLSLE